MSDAMTTRVKTRAEVHVYEFGGHEIRPGEEVRTVAIKTHWVRDERVVLAIGDDEYTVVASDLVLAVRRCSG